MRHAIRPAAALLLVIALMAALAGCSPSASTGELTSDESPVPDGMPVMYEFYTTT